MSPAEIVSCVLLGVGAVVMLTGAAGVLRFPDFYTRLHAAGKADTLGQGLILLGLAIPAGFGLISLKLALIILFVFILNPTATHALARGAWVIGLQPWTTSAEDAAEDPVPEDAVPEESAGEVRAGEDEA